MHLSARLMSMSHERPRFAEASQHRQPLRLSTDTYDNKGLNVSATARRPPGGDGPQRPVQRRPHLRRKITRPDTPRIHRPVATGIAPPRQHTRPSIKTEGIASSSVDPSRFGRSERQHGGIIATVNKLKDLKEPVTTERTRRLPDSSHRWRQTDTGPQSVLPIDTTPLEMP